jgi:hypothetical protein
MFGVQLPKRFPKKLAIGAVALLAAGGAAAATLVPVLATSAPSTTSPSTTSPSTHAPSGRAPGTKGHRHPLVAGLVRATAKETGLSAATIRQDLKAGQTFNAIAGSKAGAVENDVLNALQTRLDKAVAKGKITKQQEADLLAKAKTRIEKLMSTDLSKHTAAPAAAA